MSAVMSDQPSSNNVAEFFSPGPGERLRAARLAMGYDLPKIASELHLTGSVVEELEADDYSGIEARVFVRGYLRNYARIVGVPVESILRQFDEKWPDDNQRQTVVRKSPMLPADGGPGRGLAGALTWLLVIAGVVLFLMWWRGYLDGVVPQQIQLGTAVDAAAPGDASDTGSSTSLWSFGAQSNASDGSLRLPETGTEPAPLRVVADASSVDVPASGDVVTDNMPLPASLASTTASSAPSPETTTPSAVAATSGDAAPAPAGDADAVVVGPAAPKEVVITFEAACWVDVRDSERKFKLFGELPKGTRKVLGGEPPYKMVIGNANAVAITIDGQPFDLAPYAKGNVARFTLEP